MSYTDFEPMKAAPAPQEQPPSYNSIVPCGPVIDAPNAPNPAVYNMDMKGIPSGLQNLLHVSQFSVVEKYTRGQSSWGRSFDVLDPLGQRIYQAKEEVQCCAGLYELKIRGNGGQIVMNVSEGCECRCQRQMEVYTADSQLLGSTKFKAFSSITEMTIMNSSMEPVLLVLGPSLQTSLFGNVTFEVKSRDGEHLVGWIKCENNQFMASFPLDLEVSVKCLLLTTCFYLDSMLFSERKRVATQSRD